jgi:hypothetical protein
MGRTCGTYGERRATYRALVGKSKGRNHLEDPRVDGRMILKWIFEGGGMDWINLAHDRNRKR